MYIYSPILNFFSYALSFHLALKRTRPFVWHYELCTSGANSSYDGLLTSRLLFRYKIGHINTAYLVYISNSAGSNIVHDWCVKLNQYMHTHYSQI